MGARGPNARPKSKDASGAPELRRVLPWEVDGLSRVERVVAFVQDLPVTQGIMAGEKLRVRPWQRKFLNSVYDLDANGNRHVRTALLSIGRKNGKTQLAAALALCHLMGPEAESRGECYACANDRSQAGKTFNEMVAIIFAHPELDARANVVKHRKEIEVLSGAGAGSLFAALSADAPSKMGLSPSFIVYDELGQAPKRDLYDAMNSAMGARDEPLMVVISTQAPDDVHIMSELVDYSAEIDVGAIEDSTFHGTVMCAPDDADPWHPDTWALANPALGDFRSLSDVERQAIQAERVPSQENAFRNLILNQRVAAHTRFINAAEWQACAVEPDIAADAQCYGGLDLSLARDLTAFVLVFPHAGGFDVKCDFFLPEVGITAKSQEDRVPWDLWAKQGYLTLCPGKVVDPAFVAHSIASAALKYDLRAVAFDRAYVNVFQRDLDAAGCDILLQEHGQGWRDMHPAVSKLERFVAESRLSHGGNPILRMCAANAILTMDPAGNKKLDKHKSTGRIDGLVALAMALMAAEKFTEESLPASLARYL